MLGTAGGAAGTGFAGPGQANIKSPVTGAQVNQANDAVNNTASSQQALLNALGQTNGVQNQSDVYNQGQTLAGTLGGGVTNQNAAASSQSTLNDQLAKNNAAGAMGNAMGAQTNLNSQLAGVGGTTALAQALTGQGNLAHQLANTGGIQAQQGAISGLQGVAGQQAATAAQLQNIANGTGPNPAKAMLNQSTGQNVANQAALMAGQRGAGANVGLLARQAAQAGAGAQQQAVGQAATMQANQSLGALGQMGAQQQAQAATQSALAGVGSNLTAQQQAALGQQAGTAATAASLQQQGIGQSAAQAQAALAAQQAGVGQQAAIGATQVGQQQTQQQMLAQQAQNQIGNQVGVQQQMAGNAIANAGQQMGALGQFNQTQAGQQASVNAANAGLASTGMQGQQAMVGGLMNAAGAAAAMAQGGMVTKPRKKFAAGGYTAPEAPQVNVGSAAPVSGPQAQSSFGKFASQPQNFDDMGGTSAGAKALNKGVTNFGTSMAQRFLGPDGSADANTAPTGMPMVEGPTGAPTSSGTATGDFLGGGMSTADFLGGMAKGGPVRKKSLYREGGAVDARKPSQKAVKSGNSYDNDKIPASLSEGEIVLPRSVTMSDDPVRDAADFVRKVLAQRRKKK